MAAEDELADLGTVAAKLQDKAKSKRPLLAAALLVAAGGTLAAAVASPVIALVFLAVAAMGFKSASPLFWTIPQSGLHPVALAPAIAIINSLGNLGGFVAPFGFGLIKEQTGSVSPGLFALAAASTIAAGLVFFLKERRTQAPASAAGLRPAPPGPTGPRQDLGVLQPQRNATAAKGALAVPVSAGTPVLRRVPALLGRGPTAHPAEIIKSTGDTC